MTPAALSKFVKKVPRLTSVTSQPVKKVSSTKRSVNQPRSVRSHGTSASACGSAPAKLSPGVPPRSRSATRARATARRSPAPPRTA